MTVRVSIDLNVRVRGNHTYTGLEDVSGGIARERMAVEVHEEESGLVGRGYITEIDEDRQLVYLAVEWDSLAPPSQAGVRATSSASSFKRLSQHPDDGSLVRSGNHLAKLSR